MLLLKERNVAFGSSDGAQYSAARTNLRRAIREAKTPYKRKIEDHLSSNYTRQVWQGLQHISSYKSNKLAAADGDALLAEELNIFFARFEVDQPDVAASHTSSRCRSMRCSAH